MDIKLLIGMLDKPWFMEPNAARHWGGIVSTMITSGNMPVIDKRRKYTGQDWQTGEETDELWSFRIDEKGTVKKGAPIQVIRMDMPIAKYDNCGAPGSQSLSQLLNSAYADDTVKGILLWVDSPGGQVDGTEMLADTVKASPKPILSYADGVMASAAYWIGSSANEVVVNDSNNGYNAVMGSIGTMCRMVDYRGNLEKEGYKEHIVFADASKDKWGDWFNVMNGDYTDLKKVLNGLNDSFLNAVKANRGDKLQLDKENVLTGKTYNANEAVKYGLADAKGDFAFALGRLNSLIKKNQRKIMSTENNRFQTVLVAAGAESFEVTDNGFAMTEAQLQSVEDTLATNATTLQAAEQRATDAEAERTNLQTKLDEQTTAATTAQNALTAAQTEIQTLKDQIASFNDGKNMFLGGGAKKNDPAQDEGVNQHEFAHNKAVDQILKS